MTPRRRAPSYYAQTMPGLEAIAWREIGARMPGASLQGYKKLSRKNGIVLFSYPGRAADLLELRTTEDVFLLVGRVKIDWGLQGLAQIGEAMSRTPLLGTAVTRLQETRVVRGGKRLPYRIIARIGGARQPYRRLDLAETVARAIHRNTHGEWRRVVSGEEAEVWANAIGREFLCGLRLSDSTMRQRDYKVAQLPASLRPSVAASMVLLTEPEPTDVFLDPMCGAGTLIIERALAGRYVGLLGGDLDAGAVQAAALNIGRKHKPRQLFMWDARKLPLRAGSIGKIAANLPFGKAFGSPKEMPSLYRAFFGEVDRILLPTGRAVVLSGGSGQVDEAIARRRGLRVEARHRCTILGQQAIIHVIARPR